MLVTLAREGFEAEFGAPPAVLAVAPGRINLIGEHTDYNNGFALPLAVDRWCIAAAGQALQGPTRAIVLNTRESCDIDTRDATWRDPLVWRGRGWRAYVAGVLAAYAPGNRSLAPMHVALTGDAPIGAGLASSAALEVAVAMVLEGVLGEPVDPIERVFRCRQAEHTFAGVPCGLMDQLACVFGREGHALLIDCRSNEITPIPMPSAEHAVVIAIHSGVRHELASSEYAQRRVGCESAAKALGLGSLRDADRLAHESSELSPSQRDLVRHVLTENKRVTHAAQALVRGDLPRCGALMLESHGSLRDLYKVSCPELDLLVDLAMNIPGVFGSRMTGGGFGGCTVTLASPQALPHLLDSLPSRYAARTGRTATPFIVRSVSGASLMPP